METQPQLLLLHKNMLLMEGIIAQLQPEADLWQINKVWFEEIKKASCLQSTIFSSKQEISNSF